METLIHTHLQPKFFSQLESSTLSCSEEASLAQVLSLPGEQGLLSFVCDYSVKFPSFSEVGRVIIPCKCYSPKSVTLCGPLVHNVPGTFK